MIFSKHDENNIAEVMALFKDAGLVLEASSKASTVIRGDILVDGLKIKAHVMPLRKSRYAGKKRVGASTVGYRLILEVDCDVPIRFSVVHQGIQGSKLIDWVNKIKRINRVPNDLLDHYQYAVWCSDSEWAGRLLNQTEVVVAITDLLECEEGDSKIGHPCVFISPTSIQYFRRAANIEGLNALKEHVDNVLTLHKSAISITGPAKPRRAGYLERQFKSNPVIAVSLTLAAILLTMFALVGGFIWLIMLF